MLDNLTKIVGLGTLLLVAISFFDLSSYYSYFGIPISDYISSSEILLAFSQIQPSSSFIFIFYLALLVGATYSFSLQEKYLIKRNDNNSEPRKKLSEIIGLIVLIIILGITRYLVKKYALENVSYYESSRVLFSFGMIWALVFFIAHIILLLFAKITNSTSFVNSNIRKYLYIGILVSSLMIALNDKNHIKYNLNISGYSEFDVTCYWNDEIEPFVTSDTVVYLGLTDNYVFFYDRIDESVIIKSVKGLVRIDLAK